MSRPSVFRQECPICGRPLEIRKEYLGRMVACPQCGGRFLAFDTAHDPLDIWNPNSRLLHRADQLLEQCAVASSAMN